MTNLTRVEEDGDNLESIDKIMSELAKAKPRLFTHKQLKSFTSGFNNKVGYGAFGDVYKGEFPDGAQIVVKVLKNNMPDVIQRQDVTKQQFIAEVRTMGRTYHRNQIKLYGFCFDADIKALVYQYMENGSLDRVLYENHLHLEWVKLYDIAIETVKGLSYLHENCNPIIIHHDIKAANVLLDLYLSPKVTDFGLAKLCKLNLSQVAQSRFRGTQGYAAPEVCFGSKFITYKCDVFSFGMMLFEILRRKKNHDGEDWFPGKFWEHFQNRKLDEILIECGIMENDKEKAERLSMVALTCAHSNPHDRPSMSTVVKMLEGEIQPRPPCINPFPYYDSSSGESSMNGGSTGTRTLPPVVLPAYDKSLDEEDSTLEEYASSLTVRKPLEGTTFDVIVSIEDEEVIIPTRQTPLSSKESESSSTLELVEESCLLRGENSAIAYPSAMPNSQNPFRYSDSSSCEIDTSSGESSITTRDVPSIVSLVFDKSFNEEGSIQKEYGSSHTATQLLIANEEVVIPTKQLPKSSEPITRSNSMLKLKESCLPGDDGFLVSKQQGRSKSRFSLSSIIPSWVRPNSWGANEKVKLPPNSWGANEKVKLPPNSWGANEKVKLPPGTEIPAPIEVPTLPFKQLQMKTLNFRSEYLIGHGSRTYYATLDSGKKVALKKLDSFESDFDFSAKLKLKHDNLVELVGYCVEGNIRVLAYEFATMGSLHDILHGRKGIRGAEPDGLVLDWMQRVRIAVDVARGLEYLHEKVGPSTVVKSSNVFLFEIGIFKYLKAKIADYKIHMVDRSYCGDIGDFWPSPENLYAVKTHLSCSLLN